MVVSHEEPESIITDINDRVAGDSSTDLNVQVPAPTQRGRRDRLVLNESAKKKYNFRGQLALPRKYVTDEDSDSSSRGSSRPGSGLDRPQSRTGARPRSSLEKSHTPQHDKSTPPRPGSSLELTRSKSRSATNVLQSASGIQNQFSSLESDHHSSPQVQPVKRSLTRQSSSPEDRSEMRLESAQPLIKQQRSSSCRRRRSRTSLKQSSEYRSNLRSRSKSNQRSNDCSRSNSPERSQLRARSRSSARIRDRNKTSNEESYPSDMDKGNNSRSNSKEKSYTSLRSKSNERSNFPSISKSPKRSQLRARSRSSARIRDRNKTSYEETYPSDMDEDDDTLNDVITDTPEESIKPLLETIQKLASKRAKLVQNCSNFSSGVIQTSTNVIDDDPEPKRQRLDGKGEPRSSSEPRTSSEPSAKPKRSCKTKVMPSTIVTFLSSEGLFINYVILFSRRGWQSIF